MKSALALLLSFIVPALCAAAPDILVSDFEFSKWSDAGWSTTGNAFGNGPATGAIKRQMSVTGFKGERLVNSFFDGSDRPTGTLTSPAFKIERPFINFLIGAGGWPGKTCINLLIDGTSTRSATGDNTKPGGSERLDWKSWDVSQFIGKTATIQIIDAETGTWGHINIDHIVQSEKPAAKPITTAPPPAATNDTATLLTQLRNFETIPAQTSGTSTYNTLRAEIEKQNGRDNLTLADQQRASQQLRERLLSDPHRPTYHLLPPESFWNDVNGALFWKGRYHLFFLGREAPDADTILAGKDTMRKREVWLHASSADLLHWTWHPPAVRPKLDGSTPRGIFSGGAIAGAEKPTLIYHVPNQGTCISTADDDSLNTWTPSPKNPVIPVPPRGTSTEYSVFDPAAWKQGDTYYALIGNKNSRPGYEGDTTSLFKSTDLINWTYLHPLYKSDRKWTHVDEDAACPDFFPIGNGKHMLVTHVHNPMYGTQYYIGTFTNETFTPEQHGYMSWPGGQMSGPETLLDGQNRRIFFGWIREAKPANNGWASFVSLPRILSLDSSNNLLIQPAPELELLRANHRKIENIKIPSNKELVLPAAMNGATSEIIVTFAPTDAKSYGIKIRRSPDGAEQTAIIYNAKDGTLSTDLSRSSLDTSVRYDTYARGYARDKNIPAEKQTTTTQTAPFKLNPNEPLQLRIYIDRSVVEVFANGRQCLTQRIYPTRPDSTGISIFSNGGSSEISTIEAWDISPTNPW